MKQVASLCYGVIFKKAFSEPDIFTAFVRNIAGIELEIERVETEKSFPVLIGKVDTRYALFAEDTKTVLLSMSNINGFPITTPVSSTIIAHRFCNR